MTYCITGRGPCQCQPDENYFCPHSVDVARLQRDAERYRFLREQHWYDGDIAVVKNPKECVAPGSMCPSFDNLDATIDVLMHHQDKK